MEAPGGVEPPTNGLGKRHQKVVWFVFSCLDSGALFLFVVFRPSKPALWQPVWQPIGKRFSNSLLRTNLSSSGAVAQYATVLSGVPVIISLQAGQHGFAWDSVVNFKGIEVGTGDRKGTGRRAEKSIHPAREARSLWLAPALPVS